MPLVLKTCYSSSNYVKKYSLDMAYRTMIVSYYDSVIRRRRNGADMAWEFLKKD